MSIVSRIVCWAIVGVIHITSFETFELRNSSSVSYQLWKLENVNNSLLPLQIDTEEALFFACYWWRFFSSSWRWGRGRGTEWRRGRGQRPGRSQWGGQAVVNCHLPPQSGPWYVHCTLYRIKGTNCFPKLCIIEAYSELYMIKGEDLYVFF
jgi:hypothetical protein